MDTDSGEKPAGATAEKKSVSPEGVTQDSPKELVRVDDGYEESKTGKMDEDANPDQANREGGNNTAGIDSPETNAAPVSDAPREASAIDDSTTARSNP